MYIYIIRHVDIINAIIWYQQSCSALNASKALVAFTSGRVLTWRKREMSKYIPVDMPRIWRVTVQSGSKMKSAREEVGGFRGRTSAKSPRGERKRERKRERRGRPGGKEAKRRRRGREDGEGRERGEAKKTRASWRRIFAWVSLGGRRVCLVESAADLWPPPQALPLLSLLTLPRPFSSRPLELSPYERASLACRC